MKNVTKQVIIYKSDQLTTRKYKPSFDFLFYYF